MIALCQIRALPHYRRDAFERGLRATGYRLVTSGRPDGPQDLLVTWNRYGAAEQMANSWERDGGTTLVCENGYAGRDAEGRQYYAIAAHGHNGSGWWPQGDEDRWERLGIALDPWRDPNAEGYVLVCGQRGIGSRLMASPPGWDGSMARRLREVTPRPIKVRPHPGNQPAAISLDADLDGAAACVIWSSSSGVRALCRGIPVFYDAPHWICEAAAQPARGAHLPRTDDALRLFALRRMAWAQWSVDEIMAGEPFAHFLAGMKQRAAA